LVIPAPFEVGRKFFLLRAGILAFRAAIRASLKEKCHARYMSKRGMNISVELHAFFSNLQIACGVRVKI
tara:strand:- start:1535 stop:1741 length:207 start_codon:yes stop_codon:yes gene_type:complete